MWYSNKSLNPLRRYGDTGKALINKRRTLYIIYVYAGFMLSIQASCLGQDAFSSDQGGLYGKV